jgi:hypothetical protein
MGFLLTEEPIMSKVIDLTGRKFGRWLVKGFSHQNGKMFYWSCICDCGTERAVFGGDLKRGGSVSCGCLKREESARRLISHDMSFHPAYRSWIAMKVRCLNPSNTGYKDYGGRGITICDEWMEFDAFWHDMGPTWASGLSIDRIDVDGDYEPSNCRWATPKIQGNNRRTNHLIMCPDGELRTVTEASEKYGITRNTLFARIRYGWAEEDLFQPIRPHK